MKLIKPYILQVVLSTVLFFAFSMMHEFDWLIPSNPAAVSTTASAIPMPDVVEEPGAEDEIEHEDIVTTYIYNDRLLTGEFISLIKLYTPPVLIPPPDMV